MRNEVVKINAPCRVDEHFFGEPFEEVCAIGGRRLLDGFEGGGSAELLLAHDAVNCRHERRSLGGVRLPEQVGVVQVAQGPSRTEIPLRDVPGIEAHRDQPGPVSGSSVVFHSTSACDNEPRQ